MSSVIWSFVWLAIGVFGAFTGNDPVLVIGLVNSSVHVVGSSIVREINKKESK